MMNPKTTLLCLILPFALLHAEYHLTENGQAKCSIVLPDQAPEPVNYAGKELATFLKKISGATVPVSNKPQPGLYPVRLEITPKDKQLTSHGFRIRANASGLTIAGGSALGTLFGTYAFLEERLGMRWFFPGEDGEYCPRTPTINIGDVTDLQNPSFRHRYLSYNACATNSPLVDSRTWEIRNRMGPRTEGPRDPLSKQHQAVVFRGGHTMCAFVPISLYDTHPEYFPLIDGKRLKRSDAFAPNPCTSNPEVVKRAVDYVCAFFHKHPDGIFHLGNNDNATWCQCKTCQSLDPPEESKKRVVSTRFTIFRNQVAEGVWKKYPNARIQSWAYQNYQTPSKTVSPKFITILCDHGRCYRHSLTDKSCNMNTWFRREMFEPWRNTGVPRGIFNYYNCYAGQLDHRIAGVLCAPLEHIVADDMRYQLKLGHTDWQFNTVPPDGLFQYMYPLYERWTKNDKAKAKRDAENSIYTSQNYWRANIGLHYVQAKLAWNIHSDVDALLADLYQKYYGPAASPMTRFFTLTRKFWRETDGDFGYNSTFAYIGKSIEAPSRFKQLIQALDDAAKAAHGNPIFEKRIAKEKELFHNGWERARSQWIKRSANALHVAQATGDIHIDGHLDEPSWQVCEPITDFRLPDGASAKVKTSIKVLYSGENLYVGVRMDDPRMDLLKANCKEPDAGHIWNDDLLEIFIDAQGLGKQYVHLAINPLGCLRDSICETGGFTTGNIAFDAGAEIQTSRDKQAWYIEMKLDAKKLGGAIGGSKRWLMNVARSRKLGGGGTWTDGTYHNPASFRSVIFMKPILRNAGFENVTPIDAKIRKHLPEDSRLEGDLWCAAKDNWTPHYSSTGSYSLSSNAPFEGRHVLKCRDMIFMNPLNIKPRKGGRLRFSFAARGTGTIDLKLYIYGKPFMGPTLGTATLTPDWQIFTYEYVFSEDRERVTLAPYITGEAELDAFSAIPF